MTTEEQDTPQQTSDESNVEEPNSSAEPAAEQDPPSDPLAEAEKRAAALKDQLLRTAADFDNYRKRSRREVEEAGLSGREGLLKDLLPVFDNLERATSHADATADVAAFVSGIEMVMRQFQDTLGKLGVERVPAVGERFDPTVHEAIQQVATADVEPGHVAAEIQGGYRFGGRLIRPAMVVVAKAPEPAGD